MIVQLGGENTALLGPHGTLRLAWNKPPGRTVALVVRRRDALVPITFAIGAP